MKGSAKMKTFMIANLGCKVNAYESDAIANMLEDNGYVCVYSTDTESGKKALKMIEDIAKDIVKFDYKEKQISEYLSARIRKQILKATDIKPVVFMHFYKMPTE